MKIQEKLETYGTHSISDNELLSLIGLTDAEIENTNEAFTNQQLMRATIGELCRTMTKAKAIKLKSAIEMGRRLSYSAYNDNDKITSSALVMLNHDVQSIVHSDVEKFVVIALSRSNRLIKSTIISSGSHKGTIAEPSDIMRFLILEKASAFIIVHNHPSGEMRPSEADKQLTQKVKQGGILMDIQLLDSMIVGMTSSGASYYSFADEGAL